MVSLGSGCLILGLALSGAVMITGPVRHGDRVLCWDNFTYVVFTSGLCEGRRRNVGKYSWGDATNQAVVSAWRGVATNRTMRWQCETALSKQVLYPVGLYEACMVSVSDRNISGPVYDLLAAPWTDAQFHDHAISANSAQPATVYGRMGSLLLAYTYIKNLYYYFHITV